MSFAGPSTLGQQYLESGKGKRDIHSHPYIRSFNKVSGDTLVHRPLACGSLVINDESFNKFRNLKN